MSTISAIAQLGLTLVETYAAADVPAGGIDFPIGAAAAALLRLVGSGTVDVWQFG